MKAINPSPADVEASLRVLVGLRLRYIRRALDMQIFQFGAISGEALDLHPRLHRGRSCSTASLDAETPAIQEFHGWVAARLHRQKNGQGWSSMLLEATGGNEQAAFERFWTELDAFRAR